MIRVRARSGAVAFVALAATLSAMLVQYRTNIITTYADYSVRQTVPTPPILTTWSEVADAACLPNNCAFRAIATVKGFYPRAGVPRIVAILGGMITPYVLLCAAAVIALRHATGRARTVIIWLSSIGAMISLSPVVLVLYLALAGAGFSELAQPEIMSGIAMLGTIGMTFLAGGVWLTMRAVRERQFSVLSFVGCAIVGVGVVLLIRPVLHAYLAVRYMDRVSIPAEWVRGDPILVLFALCSIGSGVALYRRAQRITGPV